MKRILLALFGGLLFNTSVFAQLGAFSQYGKVTQDMPDNGFFAAHSNIPLGSTVRVINTETEKEIIVTIKARIPISPRRILDLSRAAWEDLNLGSDTFIRLIYDPQRQIQALPPKAAEVEQPVEPEKDIPKITECEGIFEADPLEWLADTMIPMDEVRIVPYLPNPNGFGTYNLQVGAYSKQENADKAELLVRVSGLNAVQEIHNSLHRVLAVEVRASDVYSAAQRLGLVGFRTIWVRDN
ncbi:MAG: septal ring lytic transglycosylase RlpA family protein [Treponema sp.]|jgi:rare lipoprotein A|nr:septal ring lytic transglycosylase RlpA family protein [Treponema sp.]